MNLIRAGGVFCRVILLCWLSSISASAQYSGTNGIFAEFNTSMGSFTCRLDHVLAPKTVANFIGLATGERAWLDSSSGVIKTNPLYSGNIFHRVVSGFVIQAGAPGGAPAGHPGYRFRDEFHPSLRHDSFGVLSMANNGPDSNGSQYFITVGPQPGLDDVHSVFGKLYGGSNVVYAISRVATDSNGKPLSNVTINSIAIRRIDTSAQQFNIHTNGLPVVTNLTAKLVQSGNSLSLNFSNQLNTETKVFYSTNLAVWAGLSLGFEVNASSAGSVEVTASAPQEFFQLKQIRYNETLRVPRAIGNKEMLFNLGVNGTIALLFDAGGGGLYSWSNGPIGILGYNWIQDAHRGRLLPLVLYNSNIELHLHLSYDSATSGTLKGSAYELQPPAPPLFLGTVSGTFVSTP